MTNLIKYYEQLNKYLDADKRNKLLNEYNEWIQYQNSIFDDNPNVAQPHHLLILGNHGIGIKPNDFWKIPITYQQHIDIHNKKRKELTDLALELLPALHDRFIEETNQIGYRTWLALQKSYMRKR